MKEIIQFSIPKSRLDIYLEQSDKSNCWNFWLINTVNKSRRFIKEDIPTKAMTKVINNLLDIKK
jgi:hypothetical protein